MIFSFGMLMPPTLLPQEEFNSKVSCFRLSPSTVKFDCESLVHDFMTPQPIKNAAVYFLRFIIHNWPDPEAKKILRNLRDAAGISSKLIIFDHRAIYSCESLSYDPNSVQKAPYPLLANLGVGGAGYATTLDIQVR